MQNRRLLGAVVAFESLLIVVPLIVLGAAIDWPASLDDPADVALPRLLEQEGAVRFGYLVYLGYSIAFLPVALVVLRWYRGASNTVGVVAQVALGAVVASTALRAIGIIRWLAAMFPLAERWDAAADPAERAAIAVQFEALNNYGGAIGEILGVSLFAAVFILATTALPAAAHVPGWIRPTGIAAGVLLLLPLSELAGVTSDILATVSTATLTLWLLTVGVTIGLGRVGRADDHPPAASQRSVSTARNTRLR